MKNSCSCEVSSAYCADLYGCFDHLTIKGGFTAGVSYDTYFEDIHGNLFIVKDTEANSSGNLKIDVEDLPAGLINPVAEDLLMYFAEADADEYIKLQFDGEIYDSVLLKFHGGNAEKFKII